MNARTAFRKSLAIEPAANELRRAENEAELDLAWHMHCRRFPSASAEHRELFGVYTVRLVTLRKAKMLADLVRV